MEKQMETYIVAKSDSANIENAKSVKKNDRISKTSYYLQRYLFFIAIIILVSLIFVFSILAIFPLIAFFLLSVGSGSK